MTQYTTQMDAARKGIVTPQIKTVAEKEHMPVEKMMQLVAEGKVAICANKHHTCLNPEGVGSMLRTKINVNLGVSRDCKDYDIEMQKVMKAVDLGAEAIMDLSSHGNTQPFRQKLTHECPAMIGTVPVYDSVIHYQRDLSELTAHDFIDVIRLHAEDGVDFVTLHCGITRKTIEQIKKHKRKMNIVSRGGSLVFAWMSMTGEENPFYEYFDEILDICEEHDVTISLGDACRPGCLADATDVCQIEELVRLGELTKRAWDHNVQVMVEGPGHVPLDQVAANMKVQQTICMGAPFYVLGPLFVLRCAMQGMGRKIVPVMSSTIELIGKVLAVMILTPRLGYLGVTITEPIIWFCCTLMLSIMYLTTPVEKLVEKRRAAN